MAPPPRALYQLRSDLGNDLPEILTRLTHRLWDRLVKESGPLDPHLWPEILRTLRRGFRHRLSRGQPCANCLTKGQWRGSAPHAVFLLEWCHPLGHFRPALAAVLDRHWKGAEARRRYGTILRVLEESFETADLCDQCPGRQTLADRRLWSREADPIWGGVRDVELYAQR